MTDIDLFRCQMNPDAGAEIAALYSPDEHGRVYCGQGVYTDSFEQAFARQLSLERAPLGVNSCSAALDLSMHLIGIGPGDEVITSPITCSATISAIVNRGASIVWADVDPYTGNIDPGSVARSISNQTKALIAIDWGGRSCDYEALRVALWNNNTTIPIVEDAAHCLYIAPQHGDYVAWSFGPIKHLTTGGYGGALLPPAAHTERARLLRWHGLDRKSTEDFRCAQDITESGYRYHMTDDQAVVGLANLSTAMRSVAHARENAEWYAQVFQHVPGIHIPLFDKESNYWIFTLLADDRDGLKNYLMEHHIASSQVHARTDKHTAFKRATIRQDRDLPGVAYFDAHQLSIPAGAWITGVDRERIAATVIEYATKQALSPV